MEYPQNVILVDSNDNELGYMEKLEAHQKGLLHRAFSIFLFNKKGEWLLQKRSNIKYHSAGLWSNACCSHPAPGEMNLRSAEKRLNYEMGIECILIPLFQFEYKAYFENGLCEHELDHIYYGISDTLPKPEPLEVSGWRYVSPTNLEAELNQHPENFTVWFRLLFPKVQQALQLGLFKP